MKLKMLCDVDSGLPISDSLGNQRVCGILVDDGSFIVLFVDKVTSSLYIERVINKFAVNMFCSSNFEKITDEEFTAYYDYFVAQGLFNQEKKNNKISQDQIIEYSRR